MTKFIVIAEEIGVKFGVVVTIEIQFRDIQRYFLWKFLRFLASTINHIRTPRLIMIASAVRRTLHVTIAILIVAATAQCKAMRLVAAEQLTVVELIERSDLCATRMRHNALDILKIHDFRMLS